MVGEVSIDIVIVIYVDNILVGSKDVESHVKELNMVIHALTKVGFKLKPLKCKIAYLAIQFMGAVVDGDQRGVCPLKAEVFAKMQRPRTGKEVQKVLGFVNFLRDFIPLYSCVVGPLKGLSQQRKSTMIFGCPQGGKRRLIWQKKFCQGHQCCQTQTGAKSFLWKLMQASSGWGWSFFKKGLREKLIFILILPQRPSTLLSKIIQL